MLRNYLAAALRNLVRNKLYAAINIVGLAVGFAAALIITVFVRDEFSYDNFISGAERVYNVHTSFEQSGRGPLIVDTATVAAGLTAEMTIAFPDIESIARIAPGRAQLKNGDVESNDAVYWADPSIFSVVPLPVAAGDLATALSQPDGIVLTRRMARKYFGTDLPIGQTITIFGQHPMQISAVLEDLPSNTNLNAEIFASGQATFSVLSKIDRGEVVSGANLIAHILIRLKSGASVLGVESGLPTFLDTHFQQGPGHGIALLLIPLRAVHLTLSELPAMKPPADRTALIGVGIVGGLILIIAIINFVNLITARASRRAVEVGVRKTSGATRAHVFTQFAGEALLYVTVAIIFAIGLTKILLPVLNAVFQRAVELSFMQEPDLMAGVVATGLGVAFVSGLYPTIVLSSTRPSLVLKGDLTSVFGVSTGRHFSVVGQFTILTLLILATGIIARQSLYAMGNGIGVDTSNVVVMTSSDCRPALLDELQTVPGVVSTSCSSFFGLNIGQRQGDMVAADGTTAGVYAVPTGDNFLSFFGLEPVAGTFFPETRVQGTPGAEAQPRLVVLNQRAVQQLGYPSPAAAVGQVVRWAPSSAEENAFRVIGVVRDFAFNAVRQPVNPTGYFVDLSATGLINLRLDPEIGAETYAGIDDIWRRFNPAQLISRIPLWQYFLAFYGDVLRLGGFLLLMALLAIFIACLGLFGLSAFTAEQRTKEIGIRKVMGANRADVLRLLLWQFTKPVLWANVIAWPAAYFIMKRWLEGFAYHLDLELWIFLAASALALVIAVATVIGHALLVARSRPVEALRYE